jgi:parallel beta-helix repeat protein
MIFDKRLLLWKFFMDLVLPNNSGLPRSYAFYRVILSAFLMIISTGLLAETFYISADGDDNSTGTSTTSPWKTVASSMWKIDSGDTVLLKRGDLFYETSSIYLTKSNLTLGAYGSGPRPVISGNSYQEPGGVYDPQIMIGNGSGDAGHGSTVENIELIQSAGPGITITADNAHVNNVLVSHTTTGGIIIRSESYGTIVENCEVNHHNRAWRTGESYYNDLGLPKTTWGIGIASKGEEFVIRNNHVHHGWGEGIGANCGAVNGIIEDNQIDSNKIGVYLDIAQNIVVKNNVISGATDQAYWRSTNTIGQGIGINHETWCSQQAVNAGRHAYNKNLEIRHNEVRGTTVGFFIWSQISDAVNDVVDLSCNSFLNNIAPVEVSSDVRVHNFSVTNNNFLVLSGIDSDPLTYFPISEGVSFSQNAWYPAPNIDSVKSVLDSYAASEITYATCISLNSPLSAPNPPGNLILN